MICVFAVRALTHLEEVHISVHCLNRIFSSGRLINGEAVWPEWFRMLGHHKSKGYYALASSAGIPRITKASYSNGFRLRRGFDQIAHIQLGVLR